MPWTTADVDEHKKGLTPQQKQQWVNIANSALRRCLANGGTDETCAASAIRQANGVTGHSDVFVQTNRDYMVDRRAYRGRNHLIVPVVMMVEGVHNGSHGPLLHLAEDLGRFPQAWDGRPVVVNHPEQDGHNISANSPEMIEHGVVGHIFNTHMSGNRLRAELWLEEERLAEISPETLEQINAGRALEVSVGVFTEDEAVPGIWNGEQYDGIARNHRPDHLALLPDSVGACSIDDGCGIHANKNKKGGNVVNVNETLMINALSYSGTESTAWSGPTLADFGVSGRWEDLSAVERGRVANHYLIGSGTAASFGDLKLPVVNPKTGKLNERALRAVIGGRGAAVGGVSAEQRSAARRRAYRLLNSEFDAGLTVPETLEEEKLLSMDGYTIAAIADNEQGYRELTQNVQSQLDRMDNDTKVHFLQEMYGDYFIYEARSREGGSQLFKQTYQTGDDGSVQFTGVPTEVRKKIEYIAMKSGSGLTRTKFNNNKEEVNTMSKQNDGKTPCCLAKVEQLISNEKTPWTDKDKEWLLAQEEDIIDKLIPTEEPAVDETKKQPVVQAKVEPVTAEQAMKVLKDSVSKPDDFFKILPEELRGSMQAGLKLYNEQRARMIKDIMANAKDVWTEDELKKMDNNALSKTHKAVVREEYDYSGLGSAIETNEQEALLPPGVGVEKKEDKK